MVIIVFRVTNGKTKLSQEKVAPRGVVVSLIGIALVRFQYRSDMIMMKRFPVFV